MTDDAVVNRVAKIMAERGEFGWIQFIKEKPPGNPRSFRYECIDANGRLYRKCRVDPEIRDHYTGDGCHITNIFLWRPLAKALKTI